MILMTGTISLSKLLMEMGFALMRDSPRSWRGSMELTKLLNEMTRIVIIQINSNLSY